MTNNSKNCRNSNLVLTIKNAIYFELSFADFSNSHNKCIIRAHLIKIEIYHSDFLFYHFSNNVIDRKSLVKRDDREIIYYMYIYIGDNNYANLFNYYYNITV